MSLAGDGEPTDGLVRCSWAAGSPAEREYHDSVWGVPERDPRRLFEFLTLEGAQAGLSWRTILLKRQGYDEVFDHFDVARIAAYTEADVDRCLADPRIVRNRSKVESTVGNARAWLALADPGDLLWGVVDGSPLQNRWQSADEVPATTALSERLSATLKRNRFRFVGSTISYSLMQACGLVNDHLVTCFRHQPCAQLG